MSNYSDVVIKMDKALEGEFVKRISNSSEDPYFMKHAFDYELHNCDIVTYRLEGIRWDESHSEVKAIMAFTREYSDCRNEDSPSFGFMRVEEDGAVEAYGDISELSLSPYLTVGDDDHMDSLSPYQGS